MSGAVFTLGNSVSGSLGLGDAISKFGRVAVTGLTIEQDPDTVNSCLTTRYAGLSAVTSGGVTTFLNPSLVVIPSAYNNGIVYSLHSKQVNTGDFTVTRNTEARRVNSAGQIASIGSGLPRLDYLTSGGTAGCPALLVEPAATNLALQSQDFNTTWLAQNSATVNTNTAISPDGTQNADTINLAAISDSRVRQSITVANSTTYTISCFYKNIALTAGQTFRMRYNNTLSAPNNFIAAAVIDLAAGTATYSLAGTATTGFSGTATGRIENYGNGWYRVSVSFTVGTAGAATGIFEAASVDAVPAVRSFYAWGAQLETGSVATSYIPTTAGTGSRSADVISVSGAVSGSIGQTEGTVYVEFEHTSNTAERRLIALSDGTATNRIFIWAMSNILYAQIQGNSMIIANPIPSGYNKVAFAYQQNGVSGNLFASINGGAVVSGTSTTYPPTINRVAIGSSENASSAVFQWNNRIRSAALYSTRLTNQQLQLLTTL